MPYLFEPRPGYLLGKSSGKFMLSEALEGVSAAFAACREHKLACILWDAREIEGSASIAERYALGVRIAEAGLHNVRIAMVVNPASWLSDRPLENVAVNRGAQYMNTVDMQEARDWLGIGADA